MVLGLVGALVPVAGRASAVFDNRSHLWWWTTWTSTVRWKRARGRLTRWAGQTSRWWRWWGWNATRARVWTIVGIGDAIRLLRLLGLLGLVGRRRGLLGLGRLWSKLRWLRVVWTWSHMVSLRRR